MTDAQEALERIPSAATYIQCGECGVVRLGQYGDKVPDEIKKEVCDICGRDTEHSEVSIEVTSLDQ